MSKIYLTKIPPKAVFFLFLNLAHPLLPHVQYLIQKSKKKTKKTFFCLFPNVAPPILPDVRNLIRKIPKKTFYLSLSQMSQPRFCLCPKLISKKQITLFFCLFVNVAPLLVLLPYVRNLIQKIPQKAKNHLFCLLFLNVAPPLLPYVQNLIQKSKKKTIWFSLSLPKCRTPT